ncbi:unnamed protein product [Rhizophagus irregularis]|nr:unnamed protein product [Rhizophagus irregularis]
MPQQPQVKITKGGNPVPNFEYVSYDRVQDLYEQIRNAKSVSAAPNVPRMLPDTDGCTSPSFAFPCGVAGPPPKAA